MHLLKTYMLLVLTLVAAPTLQAAEVPYDHAAFASALQSGKPVAVVFHAEWCPTCRAQAPVLKQLSTQPKYASLTLYVADFDKETALKQELHVIRQSTLVVFNKGKELTRSTGITDQAGLDKALSAVGD